MTTVAGVVKAKSANKFGFGIMVNDKWYNSKSEIGCSKGDEVEFDDGGKAYVRDLKVTKGGGGTVASSGGSMAGKGPAGTSYARGVFPIAANDGSRSIVRQNSITNAVALYTSVVGDVVTKPEELENIAYSVINIARIFEKYSAGDIDAELNKQIEETFTVT
jgi:hypothetical protein